MKDFHFTEVQFIKQRNYLFLGSVKKVARKRQGLREIFQESTPLIFAKFLLSAFLPRMIYFIMAFKFNSLDMYPMVVESSGVSRIWV